MDSSTHTYLLVLDDGETSYQNALTLSHAQGDSVDGLRRDDLRETQCEYCVSKS